MTRPRLLSIVIVSFNTRELLRRCLSSIVENPYHQVVIGGTSSEASGPHRLGGVPDFRPWLSVELVVVDNHSSDGSADMVEREFPAARLIRAASNLGFARATNLGLRESRGSLLLLLNPDTEVLGNALVTMADFLDTHRRVGVVGPSLLYPDGRPQHSAFRFPTLWMSFLDFFPLNHRLANSRLNGRYRVPHNHGPLAVDHPLGAAMMVKREALEEIGPLDESFFMYCEEVDWCLRAKRRGWQIYQIPSAQIVHHVGQSAAQFREAMLVELHRSRYLLFRKHYPTGFTRAHRVITRAGLAREMARALLLRFLGKIDRKELEQRLRAYRTIWSM